jgi:hypothetical protein
MSIEDGWICGLNNKEDYKKLLASVPLLCKPYDESNFYNRPFKLIFEYIFPDEASSGKIADINIGLQTQISKLKIEDVKIKMLN